MTAVEWKSGDRGRIGDAEFKVASVRGESIEAAWGPLVEWADGTWSTWFPPDLLAAMGAVKLPPPVPPTIGVPQSVVDNPPPFNEWVWVWGWANKAWFSSRNPDPYHTDWWMPQPSAPPGVVS